MALVQAGTPMTAATSVITPDGRRIPNPNAVVGGLVDRRPWQYWDTFNWPLASPTAALPSSVALFTVPINQLDIYTNLRKTKLDTNMTQPGQFASPDCILLQQIGVKIAGATPSYADNQKFFENCWMEFRINQKIFWEGQPWQFPAGVGIFPGGQNPTGTDVILTNGFPAPQATRRAGSFAKYIAPLQPFSCVFYFPGTPPTLAAAFKLVVFLDGLSDTVVQ